MNSMKEDPLVQSLGFFHKSDLFTLGSPTFLLWVFNTIHSLLVLQIQGLAADMFLLLAQFFHFFEELITV